MIWALVKRDPAWRTAWLVSGAVAVIFTATTAGKPAGFYQLLVLLALLVPRALPALLALLPRRWSPRKKSPRSNRVLPSKSQPKVSGWLFFAP